MRNGPSILQSASGPLTVDLAGDSYVLDFPANKPAPTELPEGFEAALGHEVLESYIGQDIFMVVLPDEAPVASLRPNLAALAERTEHGVIATAAGDSVDFVSRFFAPALGIDEDPVTGAAPLYADTLLVRASRQEKAGCQANFESCWCSWVRGSRRPGQVARLRKILHGRPDFGCRLAGRDKKICIPPGDHFHG